MIRQLRIKINNEENCRNILLSGVVVTSLYATRDDNAAKGAAISADKTAINWHDKGWHAVTSVKPSKN
jgi:hypothetical protein